MSSFNQNGQTGSAATASSAEQPAPFMNDLAALDRLIPKNLSSNKRAVIERLVALHRQNASGR